jgi:hypothetical protein
VKIISSSKILVGQSIFSSKSIKYWKFLWIIGVWNNEVLNKYVHKVQGLLIIVCKIYKWIKDNLNNVNYSIILFMANYCQISTNKWLAPSTKDFKGLKKN